MADAGSLDGKILIITGPTGSGKSGLALGLAAKRPCEIVNCDASQFYEGMAVGTAAPEPEEMATVPHHLFGIRRPDEPVDAGQYLELAAPLFRQIWSRGNLPLVVGGTGLYVRALSRGLASIPTVDPGVRRALTARLEAHGLPSLRQELERCDPDYAARIAPNDPQRTLRALEVYHGTGRPLSHYQAEHGFKGAAYNCTLLAVDMPDEQLRPRLEQRLDKMLAQGFIDECKALLAAGYDPDLRTFKALGYRELFDYLAGSVTLADARERILRSHIQYVKRQRTWFKKEPGVIWGSALEEAWALEVLDRFMG